MDFCISSSRVTFGPVSSLWVSLQPAMWGKSLEKVPNRTCPRCGQAQLNIYYSDQTDNRVGAWCEYCNLKAYYFGEELVPINS